MSAPPGIISDLRARLFQIESMAEAEPGSSE